MAEHISDCLLCNLPSKDILTEDRHWVVTRETYPVTPLHTIIATKRHVPSFLTSPARNETAFLINYPRPGQRSSPRTIR